MERVDLERVPHAERQRWRSGGEWDERASKVAVGRLDGGRWYVRRYGGRITAWPRTDPCAYAGERAEHYARGTARRWMRTLGGKWTEA